MRRSTWRLLSPNGVQNFTSPYRLFAACLVLACCTSAHAQTAQFLPEIDTYYDLNSNARVWFQAKQTREAGVPNQAQFGPTFDYFLKSLPKLTQIFKRDPNHSDNRVLILSMGYRYLPQASGAPGTNRVEPVVTLQLPGGGGFRFSDRNRADLDWQKGTFNWRYRNRLQVNRPFLAGSHPLTPYVSAELFYQSVYQKWSSTNLNAGLTFGVNNTVQLQPYYQHQNNTGRSPNQRVNALGLVLNLYFSRHPE